MEYMEKIEKLDIQTKEMKEVEPLEKHKIINNEPFSVNKYNGHSNEFLAIGKNYDDGFNQLKKAKPFIISK